MIASHSSPSLPSSSSTVTNATKSKTRSKTKPLHPRPLPQQPPGPYSDHRPQSSHTYTLDASNPLAQYYDTPLHTSTPSTSLTASHLLRNINPSLSSNPLYTSTSKLLNTLYPVPSPKQYPNLLKTTIPVIPALPPSITSSPLETVLSQSITLRDSYLSRLSSLITSKRGTHLLSDTSETVSSLTEDVQILMTQISDLLTLVRHTTIDYIEQLDKYRVAHDTPFAQYPPDPAPNYLSSIPASLDYLDSYPLLREWLGTRMTRNPLVLRNGLDERLEAMRKYSNLPPIMKDVAFRDDDLDDEEESTLIATASGDFRSGGIVENIRRSKEITTTAQQTLDPANAMKIAQNSLVDNKPSDLAKLALLQASAVLTAEESSGKRGLKSPSKSTLPTPSFYANATTFKTPSVLFALRLLRAERIILHECAHSPPSSLALSLAKIPRLPAFQSAPVASHFPFIVDEDRLLHKLKIIDENIDVHVNYYNKISATIASQVTIIPSLRLQLWWARQIYAAMESQEAGKAPVGLMVAPSTLEQAPWVTGQIDASFARAWMHSAKFRRANELTELHRLHRFAFLRIQQNRATVEDIEMEIAELQAVIADTSHAREDFEIKIETLKNRRKKTTNKLNVEIDRRLSLNNNKDARWISKTRQLLPLPYNAIQLDKEWEAERVAEYHELNPHLDKYSTPQMDHQDDFSNPARPYEKPWIEEKPKTPSLFASLDDDNDSQTDSLTSIRTSGSTKNKFACFSVFRGGFSVSRMFSLVHVLRKPPKGYHLGGYIVSCYCTRLGKQTGKLSDLPPIVTAHFMGEVLNDFQESHPALAQRNNPDSDVARWRNWCAHLKLAREILPDGRASGKVKLVHSVQKLPGEICNEVLDEGEQERENVRNPVGIIWKGGMRLRVVSLTHVTHHDDEEEQGNGLNNGDVVEMSAEMRLPPSKCFNFVGNEYFVGTIEGYKGGGYDLPGFNIKLRNVKTGATLANKDPISWTRYKEFGWDRNGKLGVKEVGDLLDFLRNCVVIREAHESHIEFCSVEIADECDLVYKSDDAVIDGKTCIATVRGGFNSGMMGASLEGFGRDGGLFIHAQCVWEGELKDMHAEVSFAALRRSGYKGGWDIRNDDGRLFFGMEHRHVSRLMKNLVFCWEGGDEEDKSNVKLKFIGGRNVIYRGGGYVGGEFCISAFYFESPGVIRVRCIKVKNSEAGELNINELMLVEAGWLQLARNIANSSEAGLKAFLDILHWGGKGELGLKKAGGVVADADVHLTKVILKSAMRVENKIAFVKISTFNYRKEGRGLKGDDGLCFDLTPWGGGGGERERCVLSRDELAEYGVVLMEKCGVGKSLARLPRHTLMMLMGKLRQNATGQKID